METCRARLSWRPIHGSAARLLGQESLDIGREHLPSLTRNVLTLKLSGNDSVSLFCSLFWMLMLHTGTALVYGEQIPFMTSRFVSFD